MIYRDYCASCHKSDGAGLGGYSPSLVNSSRVNGDVDDFISIVLNGKHSGDYETGMPAFSFLSNDQIASVVEYVRRTFGEKQERVSSAQVGEMREQEVTK